MKQIPKPEVEEAEKPGPEGLSLMTKRMKIRFSASEHGSATGDSSQYGHFSPVQFSKFLLFENVYLEQHENFTKQTYRNRYEIFGANGMIPLIVPVAKGVAGM